MNYLPPIEYNVKRPSVVYSIENNEFIERIKEFIVGDCCAIVIDNEIIFNSYEPKSIKDKIQDNIIRHEIMKYPYTLCSDMIKKNRNGKIIIYMYDDFPWFVVINYDANNKVLKFDYYKSNKYMDKYPI